MRFTYPSICPKDMPVASVGLFRERLIIKTTEGLYDLFATDPSPTNATTVVPVKLRNLSFKKTANHCQIGLLSDRLWFTMISPGGKDRVGVIVNGVGYLIGLDYTAAVVEGFTMVDVVHLKDFDIQVETENDD